MNKELLNKYIDYTFDTNSWEKIDIITGYILKDLYGNEIYIYRPPFTENLVCVEYLDVRETLEYKKCHVDNKHGFVVISHENM